MDRNEFADRTRRFAVRIIQLVGTLPRGRVGDVLGKQLLRCGTSIGANYREAIRASSRKQFVYCIEIAEREADETLYWLDLLAETGMVKANRLSEIRDEAREITAILTSTGRTAKQNDQQA